MENKHTSYDLVQMQSLPLEAKIEMTKRRIEEWYKRTGCIFCGFGCHIENKSNKFFQLKESHPRQYDYCINGGEYNEDGLWQPNKEGLGLGKVFDYIGVPYE